MEIYILGAMNSAEIFRLRKVKGKTLFPVLSLTVYPWMPRALLCAGSGQQLPSSLSPQQGRSPRYVTPVFGCQETKQLCHLPAPLCFSAWNVQSLVGQTTNYFSTKVFDGSNAPCKPGLPRSIVSNICPPSVRESLSNIYLFKILKVCKSLQQGKFSYWFHYAHSPLTATLEDAELKQWLRTDCKYCWEWEGFCCLVAET